LREDFPKLAAALGDSAFNAFGTAYLRAHPSTHHSLGRLGQYVPEFLTVHAESWATRPDMSDLAALEWARLEVFDATDAAVASNELLAELVATQGRGLEFVPALRALRLDHHVVELWRELEEGLAVSPPAVDITPTTVVVWRKAFTVFHVRLAPAEAAAFERAFAGAALDVVCEAFENESDPVGSAFKALGSWFAEGWIAATRTRLVGESSPRP
jgi:hypothetical protein